MFNKITLISFLILVCLSACTLAENPMVEETELNLPTETADDFRLLTVMTHDSFAISEHVLNQFQEEHQVEVRFLAAGDTGSAVNKAVLAKDAPLADIFYGVDNTFLSRALGEGIFEPYNSALIDQIPSNFRLDPSNHAIPVDFGDVCLNYEIAYFEQNDILPPSSLEDLIKPEYYGLLVVQNPATSSPGLAFLLTTIGHFGEEGFIDYWNSLDKNGVHIVNDWETAYYNEFSRWGGQYPIVVSYGSSPPFEVIFSETPIDSPPTAAVTENDSCYRQIEFAGILKGTKNRYLAERFIDFLLSTTFQEDIPLQMYVFPVNPNAKLDPTFVKYLDVPDNPVKLNPDDIAANREKWINVWRETILK
jgi:thiamine transport system substrate-binding protein